MALRAQVVTVCSDKNNALCKKYGADEVAAYNNGEEALKAALQAHAPFDCAYDTVTSPDDPSYEHILRPVLKKGGLLVQINGAISDFVRLMLSGRCFSLQRRDFRLMITVPDSAMQADLARIGAWTAEKKLRVLINSTVPFSAEGIEEGYDKIVSRRTVGKIVAVMVPDE